MDNTVIQQGYFVSTGEMQTIEVRSGVDWVKVINLTNAEETNDDSVRFYWQRGMINGTAIREYKSGGGANLNMALLGAPNGIYVVDTSGNPFGQRIVVSAGTNATQPQFSTANTAGLVVGDVVRMDSLATAPNLNGFDFAIGAITPNTNFTMQGTLATAPGSVSGAGFYRKVNWQSQFYPRHRNVISIEQGIMPLVVTSVAHGYNVGQIVRFQIPEQFSMIQLDSLQATITEVPSIYSFRISIDTSAFTPFTFITAAQAINAFNWALVIPVGNNTGVSLAANENYLANASRNTSIIGFQLPGGDDNPGGGNGDEMLWMVGRSFSNTIS